MNLPKHKSVKFCSNCGRERDHDNTESRRECDPGHIRVWCHACGHYWFEQAPDGSAPVEVESKSVRVVNVEPEAEEAIRVHRIELHTNRYSYVGHHLAEQLNIEPGDTGSLTWRRDPKPKPEPVFATWRKVVEWQCSACGAEIRGVYDVSPGHSCPHCGRPFNADPKHLD